MEQILINKLQNILKYNRQNVDFAIANVLLKHLNAIKSKTIIQIAKESNCAKASVVKFAKRLGLDGYKELTQRLYMEANILVPELTLNQEVTNLPESELLENYYNLISQNLLYIENNFQNQMINVANKIDQAQKIYLFGKGANLNALQIFANYLMKLNYWVNFSMDLDIQNKFAKNITQNDLCFVFSYSGLTSEMIDIYDQIKQKNTQIVFISSNNQSPMYSTRNINLFVLKNEEVQREQRNSLLSILFIIMEIVYLLSNKQPKTELL